MVKSKKRVLISWKSIIEKFSDYKKIFIRNNIEVDFVNPKQFLNESQLKKIIHKYDGVICGDDEYTKEVIKLAKKLKVISKWGTGIDSIDKSFALSRGIKVYNVKNAFTDEVAAYAISLLLHQTRELNKANINSTKTWTKVTGESLVSKKAGIVGYGRIGKKIYKYLRSFGCEVFINDIKKNYRTKKNYLTFNKLLEKCEYIFFSVDLNKSTYKMLNSVHEKFIKKRPIIINISRGKVIEENFLIKILKKKIVRKVALDVFFYEPLSRENKLFKFKENFYSAHNAYNTFESIKRTNDEVVKNLIKVLR